MATERIQIIVTETGSRIAANALAQIGKASEGANQAVSLFKNTLISLGAGLGLRDLISYSDTFTNIQNKLGIVTKSSEELKSVTTQLFNVANTTRTSFESTAIVYSRLAQATQTLGISQTELLRVTESINKTIAISGANTTEARNALIQFTQGIASGTLRGDELRSVLEQLPGLAQQIAKGMGVAYGELRTLAKEGQLTPQAIFAAIQKQQSEIDALFAKTTPTIAQSFQILENNVIKFIGSTTETSTAARLLSQGIQLLAENLGFVSNVVLAVSAVFATRFIAAALIPAGVAVLAFVGNLTAMISLMISSGSVVAVLQATFLSLSSATTFAATAMAGLRAAMLFLVATPIGIAITAVASAIALFALTTGSARAASGDLSRELEQLRGSSGATAAEQEALAAKTREATKALQEQTFARQAARNAELKKSQGDLQSELDGALGNIGIAKRGDAEVQKQITNIRTLLKGSADDAFKAAAAFDELAKAQKLDPAFAAGLIDQAIQLGKTKQLIQEYTERLRLAEAQKKNFGIAAPDAPPPLSKDAIPPETITKSKEGAEAARQFTQALSQLAAGGQLTAASLVNTGDALKKMREDGSGNAEALKLINEQFELLGINAAPKATAAAEALKILETSAQKIDQEITIFRNNIVQSLDDIINRRLELRGSDEVQGQLLELKKKFEEGKISASDLQSALGSLNGLGPEFNLGGIQSLIGKARQAIGVLGQLRAAAAGLDGKAGGGRIVEGQEERIAERQRLINDNFLKEQSRLANRSKSQREFEDRRKSLEADATRRGATLSGDELDNLTRGVLRGENANSGGGGKGRGKSEAQKEADLMKKTLEEIKGPLDEVAKKQAALDQLRAQGRITTEEYAAAQDKLKLKLLEVREDGVAGLERAQIKQAQEQRNSAKYVEEAYTAINKPAEDYKNKLAAINFLLENNAISSGQAAKETDKLRLALLANSTSPEAGFERGLLKIKETAGDTATAVEQALTNAFKGAEDAFVNFVKTGKLDFKSLADSIISDLARIAFRQAISGLLGGGGGGGGLGSILGSLLGGGNAGGGNPLGGGGLGGEGTLSLGLPLGLATGGDFEVPGGGGVDASLVSFRASPGERVSVTRPGSDDRAGGGAAQVVFNIQTPDAQSFKASQTQITNNALRAMRQGARNS